MKQPLHGVAGIGPTATSTLADVPLFQAGRRDQARALAPALVPMQALAGRRAQARLRTVGAEPVKLFIRQPFTESDADQQRMISEIMQLIDSANGTPYPFDYLTGIEAESAQTFKQAFERDQNMPFTPKNFRDHRLALLDRADAMINIRVGMSESSAFELSYHIFKGRRTPVLFLVWKQAPIKTTLIRELDDLVDVTYIEFDRVEELRGGIQHFFNSHRLGNAHHAGQPRTALSTQE
jgi:carbamoyl-phosphate synthase large subunit